MRQFSKNGGTWTSYTSPIIFSENGNVKFRGQNSSGLYSAETTYTVGNIIPPPSEEDPNITSGKMYVVKNVGSGLYLNVSGGSDANGTNIREWERDGTIAQKFILTYDTSTSSYIMKALCSSQGNNRVVNISRINGSIVNGSNVCLNDPVDYTWTLANLGGKYNIISKTNSSVSLTGGGGNGNVYVSTFLGSGNLNQQWEIIPVEDYAYKGWQYPMKDLSCTTITDYYLENRNYGTNPHYGIDIVSSNGSGSILLTPLYAAADGEVIQVLNNTGGGLVITVQSTSIDPYTEKPLLYRYCHMYNDEGDPAVVDISPYREQIVKKGQMLGYVGNTGESSGAHLHMTVYKKAINEDYNMSLQVQGTINPRKMFPYTTFSGDLTFIDEREYY